MVVAVLADDPNYEYYLPKLTTGSELIEHNFSDNWSGTSDCGSRIIRGNTILYYDRVQSKPFLFQLIPQKTAACYSATICFICAELEGDIITVRKSYIFTGVKPMIVTSITTIRRWRREKPVRSILFIISLCVVYLRTVCW